MKFTNLLLVILLLSSLAYAKSESYFESEEYEKISNTQIGELVEVSGRGPYMMTSGPANTDPKAGDPVYCNDGLMTQYSDDRFVVRHIETGEEFVIEYPNTLPLNQIQQSAYFGMPLMHREQYKDFICVEPKKSESWWSKLFKSKEKEVEEKCLEDEIEVDGECEYRCEFDEKWENGKCVPDLPLGPNQYKTVDYEGKKVIKFIDAYGKEQYTSDGKHYYDSIVKAAEPGIVRNGWNFVKETPGDVWDFFFKTKLKDKDKQLQRDLASEVFSEFKSDKDKAKEKAYETMKEKFSDYTGDLLEAAAGEAMPWPVGDLIGVPGKAVEEFAKEASSTEFSQAAMIYIKEREANRNPRDVYNNPPIELTISGGGSKGISFEIMEKAPKAVLFAKLEESYQKYKIAKELGRE